MDIPPIRLEKLREYLEVLQDKETQILIWTGKTEYVLDFVETICGLFDDSGLSSAIEEGEASAFLGEDLANLLVQIGYLVDPIDPYMDPQELANLPEMEKVRRLAKEALKSPLFKS